MRRLNSEDGATAIFVAVVFSAFLLLLMVVIDFGSLFDERHQLQNGSDSAALAVAFDCARDRVACVGAASTTAQEFANANSRDGISALDPGSPLASNPLIALNGNGGTVTVDLLSQEPGQSTAGGGVSLSGDRGTAPVRTRSVAEFGPVMAASTTPLALSDCWGLDGDALPTEEYVFILDDETNGDGCNPDTGGVEVSSPGTFGWLDAAGPCTTQINVGDEADGGDGGTCEGFAHGSDESVLDKDIPVGVFIATSGSTFDIAGVATFHVTGWYLDSGHYEPESSPAACGISAPPEPTPTPTPTESSDDDDSPQPEPSPEPTEDLSESYESLDCIRGYFTPGVLPGAAFPDPGAPNYGTYTARITY